jgi:Putative transposase
MTKVLEIVYRAISSFLIKKAGFKKKKARTGAITFIQRFGSSLNLNVHFHMLFLDGVYIDDPKGGQRFLPNPSLQKNDIIKLNHPISLRIGHYLERAGFIERDAESSSLTENALSNTEMGEHQSHSINYRIAMGPIGFLLKKKGRVGLVCEACAKYVLICPVNQP